MAPSGDPTQAEIMGERFRRVPWRRMMREAVRERLGRGPMVMPDRLEGLLAARPDPGADVPVVVAVGPSEVCTEPPVAVLPIPLVLRQAVDVALIDQVTRAADAGSVDGDHLLASALHALLLRQLMTGDAIRPASCARRRNAFARSSHSAVCRVRSTWCGPLWRLPRSTPSSIGRETAARTRRGELPLPDQQAYVRAWPPDR